MSGQEQTLSSSTSPAGQAAFPCITEIIPHRDNMLLVDEMTSVRPQGGTVRTTLRNHRPYLDQGRFDSFWMIEIMAQSVAAVYAYHKRLLGQSPAMGFVIGIDDYAWFGDHDLMSGQIIDCDVVLEYDMHPFGQYRIEATTNGGTLATATMKFMIDTEGRGMP
jgi:predicted hotdog family 3-hydroxylacyl-ACP dehydratase